MRRAFALIVAVGVFMMGLVAAPAAHAACTGAKIAVLGGATSPTWNQDVADKLMGTCMFNSATLVDIDASTPTLTTLETFDAAIVFPDNAPFNATALGDVLADYVDSGHRVSVAVFGLFGPVNLAGRLVTGNYLPFTQPNNTLTAPSLSLVADLPASPLLSGVTTFNGGTNSWHSPVTLAPGATQIAHWSDAPTNTPLVGQKGNVVGLNMYPVSNTVYAQGWDAATDGARLMASSLLVAPTVTAVNPTSGSKAGGTQVTITGTGFVTGATATVGGVSCASPTVTSATQITCTTGAHAAGAVDVTVTNPDTQVGTKASAYTYTDATKLKQSQPGISRTLPRKGPKVVNPRNAKTNQGLPMSATVSGSSFKSPATRGDLTCFIAKKDSNRKLTLRTTGQCRNVKIKVTYKAPGNATYLPYSKTITFTTK